MAKKNFTKMIARKIFVLGYAGAAWRMKKPFKMMSAVDHTWILPWPPLLFSQSRHSTPPDSVDR